MAAGSCRISRYLIGIIAGTALSFALGKADFAKVAGAKAFAIVTPFQFGMPTFDVVAIVTMSLVMIVVMIESLGMFLALGEMTDKRITQDDISRGLRVDGLGTLIGGIFNTFPYTSFSQNVGLVGVTGVRSRWVCVAAGLILLVMGVIPKIAQTAESVPAFVLGGAGLVMFGMVAATGARILTHVDFKTNRYNLFIVAIAVGFGLIPLVAPNFSRRCRTNCIRCWNPASCCPPSWRWRSTCSSMASRARASMTWSPPPSRRMPIEGFVIRAGRGTIRAQRQGRARIGVRFSGGDFQGRGASPSLPSSVAR